MISKLNVKGIHCNACVSLIKMDLEEIGISEDQVSVEIDGLNEKGIVKLSDVSSEELEKAVDVINSLEGYEVE